MQARNYLNRGSVITTNTFTIEGKTAPPQLITDTSDANYIDFDMIPVNGQAKLTWRQSLDLDVRLVVTSGCVIHPTLIQRYLEQLNQHL